MHLLQLAVELIQRHHLLALGPYLFFQIDGHFF